jgi:hypothetical protein
MNKLSIIVLLAAICFLAGCKQSPQPAALHTAGAADCHPTEAAATIVDESKPVQPEEPKPWWMTHRAHCPDTMREVEPSIRESNVKTTTFTSSDDWMNWRIQHTTCIPDGM